MRLGPPQVIDGVTGEMCMNVASMSPLLRLQAGRAAYRCKQCAEKSQGAEGAPGSASAALRVLWAYPLVEGADGSPTPMRVGAPARLLVHAPPDTWGWHASPTESECMQEDASPHREYHRDGEDEAWYEYSIQESERMWHAATSFQGKPPLPE